MACHGGASLARVQFGRAERELPGPMDAGDFDEPYLSAHRSLISGCNALLASYGYRVRGGDGSLFETLRLAALGLAASSPRWERSWRPCASRFAGLAMRPNISGAWCYEILGGVSVILPAVVERVMRLTGGLPTTLAWRPWAP